MKHRRHHIKNKVRCLKPQKSIFKRPIFWGILFFLAVILFFAYFFLFFPKIQINNIIVDGNNSVQKEEIESIVWNNINKNISKSFFLTGSHTITNEILNKFPQIESVKVIKKFPRTINISIKERVIFAVFCQEQDENCFYIDENGVIFEALEQVPKNLSIIRQLIGDGEVFTGKKVIERNIINTISKVKDNLKDNFQIDIKSAIISTPFRLNIKTSENWQIYFNLDPNLDLQIAKMNALLKDEISIDIRKTLQYIDLRFKDRAYYK